MIKVLYFAAIREQLGVGEEQVAPESLATVSDLLELLRNRGGAYAEVLSPERRVLVAVNQEYADDARSLSDGDEVALFPPVTGG
ncbi:molybdopterin converting factor subunit 1 [Thiohalorhabdus methylotrophus]|uniref:Molybdopterin synthase sulfur carrier subunit n=1 Tax=Thiohalorhabdus methylotrophus TaxID=3242694 RepID=A0ABV4TRT0_9GAMM